MSPREARLEALKMAREDAETRKTSHEELLARASSYAEFLFSNENSCIQGPILTDAFSPAPKHDAVQELAQEDAGTKMLFCFLRNMPQRPEHSSRPQHQEKLTMLQLFQRAQKERPECYRFSARAIHEAQKDTSLSPRSGSKDARMDSHSKADSETVAQPSFVLSVEELLQIIEGPVSRALADRALNELKRRSGEGKASS